MTPVARNPEQGMSPEEVMITDKYNLADLLDAKEVYDEEVERVARVCDYWVANPIRPMCPAHYNSYTRLALEFANDYSRITFKSLRSWHKFQADHQS